MYQTWCFLSAVAKKKALQFHRGYSQWPSKIVRQTFVEFFKSHNHKYVPSSSVIPYNDASLPFVNAGMNQFKPIFLGKLQPPFKRAVNSQKCIRVGGKHNDLEDVGKDGYHHTFFEMLGSWSFNDYFKHEACSMAWQLLTDVYKIPPDRIFVTYFAGDKSQNLKPDHECMDVWQSLGVGKDHILPFGMKENFWEMGLYGPCGPCSEIHINKSSLSSEQARMLVNQGNEMVVEIWNLVFMQYNRLESGNLEELPGHHIDTGMGLERLVALLQNKGSNYETDLFMPLISAIHKISGVDEYTNSYDMNTVKGRRDCAYRLLADHVRMITVALADGAFPDGNHRLRRVIRQTLVTSKYWFNQNGFLVTDLMNYVVDNLKDVYPELGRNLRNIQTLFRYEEEVFMNNISRMTGQWKTIVETYPEMSVFQLEEHPRIIEGFRAIEAWKSTCNSSSIPGHFAFKLYDTYGLGEDTLSQLANLMGLGVEWNDFQQRMATARQRTQQLAASQIDSTKIPYGNCNIRKDIPHTDAEHVYNYKRLSDGSYVFPSVDATIQAILGEVSRNSEVIFVVDKSNFYSESGGQVGDTGILSSLTGRAEIVEVRQLHGHLLHRGVVMEGCFKVNDLVKLDINVENRLKCMANHTATHLLQAVLKNILKVTCQKSSLVTPNHLKFDFGVFQKKFDAEEVEVVEKMVRELIRQQHPVDRYSLPLHQAASQEHITLVPGETYPETVTVLRITTPEAEVVSLEPCCGTHVCNTGDIQDFAIVSLKSTGLGSRSVKAVTRDAAIASHKNGVNVSEQIEKLENSCQSNLTRSVAEVTPSWISHLQEFNVELQKLQKAMHSLSIPFVVLKNIEPRLSKIESDLRVIAQDAVSQIINRQVKLAMGYQATSSFIVCCLSIPAELLAVGNAKLSLIKATRHCPTKPIFVIAVDDGSMVGRCTVPQNFVTTNFNAEKWVSHLLTPFDGRGSVPKGQDPKLVFSFRSRKIKSENIQNAVSIATKLAEEYAANHLSSRPISVPISTDSSTV